MKGVSELSGAAVTLIILVFIVAVGSQILGQVRTAVTDFGSDTDTVNCTLTNSSQTLGHQLLVDGSESAIRVQGTLVLTEGTHPTGNYTITSYVDGTMLCHEPSMENQTVDVSYSFTLLEIPRNATSSGLTAMDEFANWFTILVLIIIAVFIIAMLLRGFGGVSRGA